MKDNDRDERRDRGQQRRSKAQEVTPHDTPHDTPPRRKDPYKRDRVDYNDYLQEEALENEWFENN